VLICQSITKRIDNIRQIKRLRRDEMGFWERVKKDIRKGINEGMFFLKDRKAVARKRAKKLPRVGQDTLKTYELQVLVQRQLTELGGRIYDLSSKKKNPMLDPRVKTMIARLNKLEEKIASKIERNAKKHVRKVTQKHEIKSKRKTDSEITK